MFLGLEGEGIRVNTGVGGAGVMVVRLDLVEVLTLLLLEAVLTVEDDLEGGEGTRSLLGEGLSTTHGAAREEGHTRVRGGDEAVRESVVGVGIKLDLGDKVLGGEVPKGRLGRGVGEAPHELLDGVVVGEADLLGGGLINGIGTGVLHLLNQIFVALLGKSPTLLSVKVDVVGPDLKDGRVEEGGEIGREVDINADLMVLQSNEGQVESGVPVEEENQRKVDTVTILRGGHFTPRSLLGLIEVKLGVKPPPLLVVLVNSLTSDR